MRSGVAYNSGSKLPKLDNVKTLAVRGLHVEFDVDVTTAAVTNYKLTGAANDLRLVTEPTVVFASKAVVLSAAQQKGLAISSLQLDTDSGVLLMRTGTGDKIKLQFNDAAQGGIFQVRSLSLSVCGLADRLQMETEFAANTEFVHTLGPTLFCASACSPLGHG